MSVFRKSPCAGQRQQFPEYLDGTLTGVAMGELASHLDSCAACADEFQALRATQSALGSLGRAAMPLDLQTRLRAAISMERERNTHRPLLERLAVWARPLAMRGALATVVTVVMIGSVCGLLYGTPAPVEANDEPLGAMTSPHFLYSEVPAQPIEVGRDVPILVEAKIDEQGRVYDYSIVYGPNDQQTVLRVEANLLSSRFKPATVFGVAVQSRVMMTYSGVSVRG